MPFDVAAPDLGEALDSTLATSTAVQEDLARHLAVLPREVVNAAGGGLAVQGGVGSVVVVVVEPGLVGGFALGLAGVGVGVGFGVFGSLFLEPQETSPAVRPRASVQIDSLLRYVFIDC